MALQLSSRAVLRGCLPPVRGMGATRTASTRKPCLRVSAVVSGSKPPVAAPAARRRVLPLLAEMIDANALVQGYEAVAGRGAMIGLLVATTFELLIAEKDAGLFSNWQSSPNGEAEAFAFVAMALITLSAALAAASTRKLRNQMGQKLLEPVITSLTSGQRSIGSLSKRNVDKALDYVIDSVFNQQMIKKNFPMDD